MIGLLSRRTSPSAAKGNALRKQKQKRSLLGFPVITKGMVRDHVRKLLKKGDLKRKPKTGKGWRLAEFDLAKRLIVSPLRLAFFISEVKGSKTVPSKRLVRE